MSNSVARRGITSGTPVHRAEGTQRQPNPVTSYFLTPEQLAPYRDLGKKPEKAPMDLRYEHQKELEGVNQMSFKLTREEFLQKRADGMRQGEIAREQGVTAAALVHHLRKWGLKDKVIEEREIAAFIRESAQKEVASSAEPVTEEAEQSELSTDGGQPVHNPVDNQQKTPLLDHEMRLTYQPEPTERKPFSREVTLTVTFEERMLKAAFEAVAEEAHEIAVSKGWHDKPVEFPVALALIHSEVSEALEADRKGMGEEKVAEELADVVIRVMDIAGARNLDLAGALFRKMEKNRSREYRHGNMPY